MKPAYAWWLLPSFALAATFVVAAVVTRHSARNAVGGAAGRGGDGDGGVFLVRGSQPCTDLASCEKACEAGNGPACTFAGRYYEFAKGVPEDVPRALALYERACDRGYLGGCYNEGVVLERGRGVAHDPARAAVLYQRVCEGGSTTACEAADRLQALLHAEGGVR